MKKATILITLLCIILGISTLPIEAKQKSQFVTIKGEKLINPDGSKLYIVGTNLGNWLYPEATKIHRSPIAISKSTTGSAECPMDNPKLPKESSGKHKRVCHGLMTHPLFCDYIH